MKEVKRRLGERPGGFDGPAFRQWFRRIEATKFFGRPFPPGPEAVREISDQMAQEFDEWRVAR